VPVSVRLPPRVEQKLADYCVAHKMTKSEAIKRALEQMFQAGEGQPSPFDLGREFFERNLRTKPTRDVARHSKRLLQEHFRARRR
jgi:hypothetical protein